MNDATPALRYVAFAMMIVCGLAVPLAVFPSVDIYQDVNDCFAAALSWHHGSSTCQPEFKFVASKSPAFPAIPALLVLGLGAFALYRWPRPLVAMLWSLAAVALVVVCAVATFDFEIFGLDHKEYRASAAILGVLYAGITLAAVVTFVAMPILMITRAVQRRRAEREALAPARVVRR